jgi:hypothetical protein
MERPQSLEHRSSIQLAVCKGHKTQLRRIAAAAPRFDAVELGLLVALADFIALDVSIVPGYAVADVVLQGLGGGFAFGLHDFLSSKTLIQTGLATAALERPRAWNRSSSPSCSIWAMIRAAVSVPLPAAKGATIVTCRVG